MRTLLTSGMLLAASTFAFGCESDICDPATRRACGGRCNPYLERLAYSVKNAGIDRALVLDSEKCGDLTLGLGAKDKDFAKAAAKGCIRSNKKIDAKTRDWVLKKADEVTVSDQEYDSWLQSCTSSRKYVLLMDSRLPKVVYCKHSRETGQTNTDDILKLLSGVQGITVGIEPTHLEWSRVDRVLNVRPNLILLHASAFYEETKAPEANKRVLTFLEALKGRNIKVLVYTRGLPDARVGDSPEERAALEQRWKNILNAEKKYEFVSLFIMPRGHEACFTDPDDGAPFRNAVVELL